MVITVFSQPLFRMFVREDPPDFSREMAVLDSLEDVMRLNQEFTAEKENKKVRLFPFDPNDATAAELESLGIRPTQARRIINYRGKGGRFRQKADLLKIYGLDSVTYQRLYPFIDLPAVRPARHRASVDRAEKPPRERIGPATAAFDLNDADTATLKKIRGIGPVLAERIVRYRARLGGFVAPSQLHEVYRLDSMVIDALFRAAYIAEDFVPRVIPLNTSDEYVLAVHPYIGKTLAHAIVAYRYQHGSFGTVDELRHIHHVDDSVFYRIRPYLSVD